MTTPYEEIREALLGEEGAELSRRDDEALAKLAERQRLIDERPSTTTPRKDASS